MSRLPLLTAPLVEKTSFYCLTGFLCTVLLLNCCQSSVLAVAKTSGASTLSWPRTTLPARVHKRPEFRLRGSVPHNLTGWCNLTVMCHLAVGHLKHEPESTTPRPASGRPASRAGYRFLAPTAGPGQSPDQNRPYQWGIAQGFPLNFQMVFGQPSSTA